MINLLVVWKRPDNSYYYRIVSGYYCPYNIGYHNQYGHEVVLTIKNPYKEFNDNYFNRRFVRLIRLLYKKYGRG